MQPAVCYYVADMGEVVNDFDASNVKIEHAARFFFELDEKIPATMKDHKGEDIPVDEKLVGLPYALSTYDINLVGGPKANLTKIIKGMLGKDAPERCIGFDLSSLVGTQVVLNVQHKTKADGSTTAFIKAEHVMRPGPKAAKVEQTLTDPPPWLEDAKQRNKDKVLQARGASNTGGSGLDEVPFARYEGL
jgi:hypothetical protein